MLIAIGYLKEQGIGEWLARCQEIDDVQNIVFKAVPVCGNAGMAFLLPSRSLAINLVQTTRNASHKA